MGHSSEILHYIPKTTGNTSVVQYDCNAPIQNTAPKRSATVQQTYANPFKTKDESAALDEMRRERGDYYNTVITLNNLRIKNTQMETLKRDLQEARRKTTFAV